MATHSNVLVLRIPGMGELSGLLSMGSHRVGHDWNSLAAAAAWSLYVLEIVNSPLFISKSIKKLFLSVRNLIYCFVSLNLLHFPTYIFTQIFHNNHSFIHVTIIFMCVGISASLNIRLKCLAKLLSHVWLFATPWTVQSMEFSRPEYCSG